MNISPVQMLFYTFITCAIMAAFGVLVVNDFHRESLQMQLHYVNNVQRIQHEEVRRNQEELRMVFVEYQDWRRFITGATRMGWGQAQKFLLSYPLDARQYYYESEVSMY